MSMDDLIFIEDGNEMTELHRSEFAREEDLQKLIARYPDLLSGSQLNPENPVRWLLVTQEAGIPGQADGGNRWAVDHLLLDQHGRPTFVEVKRSTDTRIRREVVGQLLEYAANATAYWPMSRIRELAGLHFGSEDALADEVAKLIGGETDVDDEAVEAYWAAVERNLDLGNVRLLFVADVIPNELRRIIEYLNDHMTDVDVLGVEIGHYHDGQRRALVPRVVGQTERARARKGAGQGGTRAAKTTEDAFLAKLEAQQAVAMHAILDGARERGLSINWGTKGFSIRVPDPGGVGGASSIFYGYPPGANGRELLHVQGYLAYLPDDLKPSVAERFMRAAPFEQRTEKTMHLDVPGASTNQLGAIAGALWEVADMVTRRLQSGVDAGEGG